MLLSSALHCRLQGMLETYLDIGTSLVLLDRRVSRACIRDTTGRALPPELNEIFPDSKV